MKVFSENEFHSRGFLLLASFIQLSISFIQILYGNLVILFELFVCLGLRSVLGWKHMCSVVLI